MECRSWGSALTALLVLLLTSHSATVVCTRRLTAKASDRGPDYHGPIPFEESNEAATRLPELREGFLYPVLSWGPNNQVAGIKEVLALGRLLQRTVVVHEILNHYDEQQAAIVDGQPVLTQALSMPFDLVFDFDHLSRHQSVVTQAELLAAGWDGVLDAVLYFHEDFLPQIKNALLLNVSDQGATYVKFPFFNCTEGELKDIAKALVKYKYVGVIVYEHIVPGAGHALKLYMNGNICHDTFMHVTAQLTKSAKILELASKFRQQKLGGQNYMAVHVRPYPDKCLHVWRHPKQASEREVKALCKNPRLLKVFVGQTRHTMEDHELQGLFVMSYPSIRDTIAEMYGAVGLAPVFYDEADLEAAVGYKSVSLLGMVEEEIAAEANFFIGTSFSSITGIITQERFVRGIWPGYSTCFTRTT